MGIGEDIITPRWETLCVIRVVENFKKGIQTHSNWVDRNSGMMYNHFDVYRNEWMEIMEEQATFNELLDFFKALADENRLRIVGLLAQAPHSVEELSEMLGLSASTVSHHLTRLARAGLVSARPEGHYYFYRLQTETLHAKAERLLSAEALPRYSSDVDVDSFDRKVLDSFTDAEGRITAFPAQEKKLLVLLRHVVKAFETGRHYSEKEVNEILSFYNEDKAMLRRSLVEYRLMGRQGGGGDYWRTDQE